MLRVMHSATPNAQLRQASANTESGMLRVMHKAR